MRALLNAIVLLAAFAGGALAQDETVLRYRQSAAVLAHYPDVPLKLSTPAFAPGRTTLTSHSELDQFIARIATAHAPVVVGNIGPTPEGRSIPILYVSPERYADPAALRAAGRPIVWLISQQHGNEPAGGEAMLAIAEELISGELRPLVDKLTIAIVPRANPDGAAADLRDTAAKLDMNRDHLSLRLAETRALHAAVQQLPPDLVIDAHEFTVAARWLEKFGGVQAVDLMLLSATHPMVPSAVRDLADRLFRPAIETAVAAHGLKTFDYHTTSNALGDRTVVLGGNSAGIARNAFGLMGAPSLLLETRGVGVGRDAYQRRVATHYIAIKAALETAAANATHLRATVAGVRRDVRETRRDIIVDHRPSSARMRVPLIEPSTGAPRETDVELIDSRDGIITQRRSPAAGYILLPPAAATATTLALIGASTCHVSAPLDMVVEAFEVLARTTVDARAINLRNTVKGTFQTRRHPISAGAVYVSATGAAALRIATALEPDLPGSLFALDIIQPTAGQSIAPVLRVPGTSRLSIDPRANDSMATACLVSNE